MNANKTKRTAKTASPTFEALENRELFVAGTWTFPAEVATDAGHDGVVMITSPSGGTCSGALLSTGVHVLTAAHCVDNDVDLDGDGDGDEGNGVIDAGTYRVHFELPSGTEQLDVASRNVSVPPEWNGNWRAWQPDGGNDIAIIELPSFAPLQADRYDIYRNSDEVGKSVEFAGYGRTGCANPCGDQMPGHIPGTGGIKREGANEIDRIVGTTLRMDFDVGDQLTAPGDSGGPSFISGRIAGVASYGSYQEQGEYAAGSTGVGATANVTRVSDFAGWIDDVFAQGYDLRINIGQDAIGNNGKQDVVQVSGHDGVVSVVVNGERVHTGHRGNLDSFSIVGSRDSDRFWIGTGVGNLTIHGGGGSDHLWRLSTTNFWTVSGRNAGSTGSISFRSIENLKGGGHGDTFTVNPGGRITGEINGGGGTDTLSYRSHTAGVRVDLAAGTASYVGRLRSIENVKGGSGNDVLIGNGNANTLLGYGGHDLIDGLAGNDTVDGGNGRDVLVGGVGRDTLRGGDGQDLLIGGRLNSSRQNVMNEWRRMDLSYAARIRNLRLGAGRSSGARLNTTTAPNDGAYDELIGGSGTDWYWGYADRMHRNSHEALK